MQFVKSCRWFKARLVVFSVNYAAVNHKAGLHGSSKILWFRQVLLMNKNCTGYPTEDLLIDRRFVVSAKFCCTRVKTSINPCKTWTPNQRLVPPTHVSWVPRAWKVMATYLASLFRLNIHMETRNRNHTDMRTDKGPARLEPLKDVSGEESISGRSSTDADEDVCQTLSQEVHGLIESCPSLLSEAKKKVCEFTWIVWKMENYQKSLEKPEDATSI